MLRQKERSAAYAHAVRGRVRGRLPARREERNARRLATAQRADRLVALWDGLAALLMHHELGFRRFCESVSPSLVDLVRQRYPFADEDPERRAYVKQLEAELATPRTVAFNGRRVEVAGGASASECREALGIACDLDIDIDLDMGVDIDVTLALMLISTLTSELVKF